MPWTLWAKPSHFILTQHVFDLLGFFIIIFFICWIPDVRYLEYTLNPSCVLMQFLSNFVVVFFFIYIYFCNCLITAVITVTTVEQPLTRQDFQFYKLVNSASRRGLRRGSASCVRLWPDSGEFRIIKTPRRQSFRWSRESLGCCHVQSARHSSWVCL